MGKIAMDKYFRYIDTVVTPHEIRVASHSLSYIILLVLLLWLYSHSLGLGRFFSFLILYTVGWTPWTGDQPVARPLPTHRTAETHNKRTHPSMPIVGFEPMTTVFQRPKAVHASDLAATVVGTSYNINEKNIRLLSKNTGASVKNQTVANLQN
jgi:hypothetical protein